ncbi:unnamed protein product [Urochloa humidicola]
MSFRRFVYLVTEDYRHSTFLLRRINTSRFFFPKRDHLLHADPPPPVEAGRLPPPTMKFDPPTCDVGCGYLDFMLFSAGADAGSGGRNNHNNHKVLVTDLTGRALLYDPESSPPTVRSLPSFTAPMRCPVSFAGGDKCVYVLDTYLDPLHINHHLRTYCFDAFVHVRDGGSGGDWRCISLPPPPYAAAAGDVMVDSYAVVGGSFWASSTSGSDLNDVATYAFDTASQAWAKAGDWAMPFAGRAHHVPDHGVWIGVSFTGYPGVGVDRRDASVVCAADLAAAAAEAEAAPPVCATVWRDVTSPQWVNMSACLVHLGGSRFFHARFFEMERPYELGLRSYAVFTGIEVERRRLRGEEEGGGGEVGVVKHRSVQYTVGDRTSKMGALASESTV